MSWLLYNVRDLAYASANFCEKDVGNLPDSVSPEVTLPDLGDLFLSEAKSLWEAENGHTSLTNVQSLFLLCYK